MLQLGTVTKNLTLYKVKIGFEKGFHEKAQVAGLLVTLHSNELYIVIVYDHI